MKVSLEIILEVKGKSDHEGVIEALGTFHAWRELTKLPMQLKSIGIVQMKGEKNDTR